MEWYAKLAVIGVVMLVAPTRTIPFGNCDPLNWKPDGFGKKLNRSGFVVLFLAAVAWLAD